MRNSRAIAIMFAILTLLHGPSALSKMRNGEIAIKELKPIASDRLRKLIPGHRMGSAATPPPPDGGLTIFCEDGHFRDGITNMPSALYGIRGNNIVTLVPLYSAKGMTPSVVNEYSFYEDDRSNLFWAWANEPYAYPLILTLEHC